MGKIQDLPLLEQPRKKALRYGLDTLSDGELIAILLGSGYEGKSAREIGEELLLYFNGLLSLSDTPINVLKKYKGIKEAKSLILGTAFELARRLNVKKLEQIEVLATSEYLYNKYLPLIGSSNQEVLVVIITNLKRKIIYERILFKGSEDEVIFSYRDVFKEVAIHNGKGFYLIHNHPNGEIRPSSRDIVFTWEMERLAKQYKISFHDHLIIGKNGYYSFQKNKK